jgi:predicted PurR-regulated permease PerM
MNQESFTKRSLIAAGVATAFATAVLLLVFCIPVFLIVFAGILLGAVIYRLSFVLASRSGLPYLGAYAIVVALLVLVSIGTVWTLGHRIAQQFDQLTQQVTEANQTIVEELTKYTWGQQLLERIPSSSDELTLSGWNPIDRVGAFFSSTIGVLAAAFAIAFLGLYFAASPAVYLNGVTALVPPSRRDRIRALFERLGDTLWKWTLGRLASMTVIAVGASLGLWMLGIPLPITLGVLAGLLTFIPNVGGFLGVVLPSLLAFQQGSGTVLWVLALFAVLQGIESNVFTPLVQQHQVNVPPGLLLAAQLLMGVMAGILGVAMATPLTAVLMVCVKELYVTDILEQGDRTDAKNASEKSH